LSNQAAGDLSGVGEWEPFRGKLQQELSAVTPSEKKKIDRKPNTDFLMILLVVTRPFPTYPTVFLSLIFTPPLYFVFPFII
jgi:hypothetical protein